MPPIVRIHMVLAGIPSQVFSTGTAVLKGLIRRLDRRALQVEYDRSVTIGTVELPGAGSTTEKFIRFRAGFDSSFLAGINLLLVLRSKADVNTTRVDIPLRDPKEMTIVLVVSILNQIAGRSILRLKFEGPLDAHWREHFVVEGQCARKILDSEEDVVNERCHGEVDAKSL